MKLGEWFKSGSPWIWMNAAAVSASLIMVFGLMALIMVRGLGFFWPADVVELDYKNKQGEQVKIIAEYWDTEEVSKIVLRDLGFVLDRTEIQSSIPKYIAAPEIADTDEDALITRYLLKIGNRDIYGSDFRTVIKPFILDERYPESLIVVVRREWGNFYGFLQDVKQQGEVVASGEKAWQEFQLRMQRANDIHDQIREIERGDIGKINYGLEKLRLQKRKYELDGDLTETNLAVLQKEQQGLNEEYTKLQKQLDDLYKQIGTDSFTAKIQDDRIIEIPFSKVVKAYRPNSMNWFSKLGMYFANIWEFLADEPREANTEGGVFPAIFGTVIMVMIMAVLVTPLGVIAAVYLREYAKQGVLTRTIRIAVNNLAGVPSIVYGVFGLGFFVYFLGGSIDQLFFPEALPAPTFGTPGIMWSSLTLAILTLPVVIVATEEGLSRIPKSIREGSLALGATKFETLWRTIIPMSSPAIMTGLILAVARAAGEVAPLMLVGVVKLAPSLPVDGNVPFVHLDRKFMHLGFHIYDVGFQSPNVEAARPLVYATSLLLVLVIIALNLVAIQVRNRLREKYKALES